MMKSWPATIVVAALTALSISGCVALDGRVWFVGHVGNYVAVLDPNTGHGSDANTIGRVRLP